MSPADQMRRWGLPEIVILVGKVAGAITVIVSLSALVIMHFVDAHTLATVLPPRIARVEVRQDSVFLWIKDIMWTLDSNAKMMRFLSGMECRTMIPSDKALTRIIGVIDCDAVSIPKGKQ